MSISCEVCHDEFCSCPKSCPACRAAVRLAVKAEAFARSQPAAIDDPRRDFYLALHEWRAAQHTHDCPNQERR